MLALSTLTQYISLNNTFFNNYLKILTFKKKIIIPTEILKISSLQPGILFDTF